MSVNTSVAPTVVNCSANCSLLSKTSCSACSGAATICPAPYKWCLNIPYSKCATCSIYFLQEFLLSSDAVSSYVYMWTSQSLQITCASCLKRNDSVLSSISRRNVNQYSRIFLAKNEKQYIYMPALSVSPQQKRLICSK